MEVLDVRTMAPRDRHSTIFSKFGALKAGEGFILVNDHEPKPLLYQFQAEHDGEFEWWPLERGPEAWRVLVAKRTKALDRTVTDYMQTDHARLDGIFADFSRAWKDGRWEEAQTGFCEFALGLKRHIQVEEEILFPIFEDKTGMRDAGPTVVMRMEHKDIKAILDALLAATVGRDSGAALKKSSELTAVLADHNMKEEHILYPETDQFLTEGERPGIIKKSQAA